MVNINISVKGLIFKHMKHFILATLLLIVYTSTYAQTFEKENFIYQINEDGGVSWCGMTSLGSKHKKFLWKEGLDPKVDATGNKDDIVSEYKSFKRKLQIPQSIKYNGKKYFVNRIAVDNNYFFRPLDEQKKDGVMPWLCKMSILLPPTITEVPERMWALHYEGLQILFKKPQSQYVEEDHCIVDKNNNRIMAIDFSSMPMQLQVAREVILPTTAKSLSPYSMRGHIIYSVKWPEAITEIEPETFKNCIFMNDVTIPGHIKTIGASAFEDACGLGNCMIEEGVERIEKRAFYNSIVTTISMSNSCNSLGEEAFAECHLLKQISLSDHLAVIPEKAFKHTFSLDRVNIPPSVQEIRPAAFQESRLFSISFSHGLKSIAPNTFSGCKALFKLKLPSSLTTIGTQAFKDCVNLSYIKVPASCETIEDEAFTGSNIQLMEITNPQVQMKPHSLDNMPELKYINLDCQTNADQATPLIESIFNSHSTVFLNLQQPAKLFREKFDNQQWKVRLRNDSWRTKNNVVTFSFVDKRTMEANNNKVSSKLTRSIQEASRLCWCRNEKWESYHNYGGFTLDEDGRPVVRLKGNEQGLQYLREAIEFQLCGISRYILNTGLESCLPKVLFEDGMESFYSF